MVADRVILLSASVAGGNTFIDFARFAEERVGGLDPLIEIGDDVLIDDLAAFAHAVNRRPAVEAAFRTLVWGYAAELLARYRPALFDESSRAFAEAFGVRSKVEQRLLDVARPVGGDLDAQADRLYQLQEEMLFGMVEAATSTEIVREDSLLAAHMVTWNDFFLTGLERSELVLRDFAPDGPVWDW